MARETTPEGAIIGRRIRQRRGKMTLGQLSAYSGLSRSYLSQLENGQVPDPSVRAVRKIAIALGCTLNDIVGPDHEGETETVEIPKDGVVTDRRRLANLPGAAIEQVNKVVEALGLYTHEVSVEVARDVLAPERPADDAPKQGRDGHDPHHAPPEGTYHG